MATSPLAPDRFPEMPAVAGVRFATHNCGIRYRDRDDVLLVELAPDTAAAGVFTRSQTAAAPVLWCRDALTGGRARALLVNAGNANAFTGHEGARSVKRTVEAVAALMECPTQQVFVASTGVIGETLPDGRITDALAVMQGELGEIPWDAAARAIMTTDTFPKGCTRRAMVDGTRVVVNGIAKGSGMIAPNMATLLAYLFTDAAIEPPVLQSLLSDAAERSFNCTTVDGDTSTSDTLMLFATGTAGHEPIASPDDPRLVDIRAKLDAVCLDLAHQVVRDGEGASKFISIRVTGAESDAAARRIGLTIANSPLVKTAVAGADANWGRIVMAAGKAGDRVDRERMSVRIGGHEVAALGAAVPGYDESPVAEHMRGQEIQILLDVGVGTGEATVWTCDLTRGYIDINADYRS